VYHARVRALLLLTLLPLPALAGGRLRHEYVPPSFFDAYPVDSDDAAQLEPGEPLPNAVTQNGQRLPAPGDKAPDAPKFEPFDGASPPPDPGDILRPSAAVPDRKTETESKLTYHAVFNPEVAPLRRNVAFDAIAADYRLSIAPGPLAEVPLSPRKAAPDRELFWGDVSVDAVPGRPAPIPSVAPDMGILAVRTEPPQATVRFLKDGADNYYVGTDFHGTVRVVFLADAHRSYFSAPVPDNVPLGAGAGDPATALPPAARAAAARVMRRIGIDPSMPFAAGMDRLVGWFRAFKAGPPPARSGDIYEDLALGQVGVCRHRAFAFLVTARAAGVPTRYVQNEAHAFVEVRAPDGRWRRVDLGGEAPSLDVKGGAQVRLHTPPPDPYPKPQSYLESYSAVVTHNTVVVPGAPGSAGAASGPGPHVPLPGEGTDAGLAPGSPGSGGVPTAAAADAGPTSPPGLAAGDGAPPPGPAPHAPAPHGPGRRVALHLDSGAGDHEAFRGEALPFAVEGSVLGYGTGDPAGGVPVQIYLVPVAGGAAYPVGPELRADGRGHFAATLTLPPSLPLGRYHLVAASGATSDWAAGRSDR
jgi:hypothetical protein